MGENLVSGLLKNIENMASVNIQQNVAILTSVKKTNTILSKQIGKELTKQTGLLKDIANALTSGTFASISLFAKGGGGGLENLFKKGGSKMLNGMAMGFDTLAKSIKKFAEAVNEIDEKKFKLVESMFNMGKKILMFAALVALAAPLLLIGLLTTLPLLLLWVNFFNWVGDSSKKLKKGAKMLLYMALSTAIITLTVMMVAYALGDPLKTLIAFTLVAGSLLVLTLAYYLISKISKPLKTGVLTMLFMALTTAILVAIVIMASKYLGSPMNTLIAFGLMAGALLVLAGTFYIIGLVKGNVIQGAIALLIGAVSLIVISVAVKMFLDAISSVSNPWESLAMLSVTIVGLGLAMAAAGTASALILPGAAAMLIAAVSLIPLMYAVKTWMEIKPDADSLLLLGATIVSLGVAMSGWGLFSWLIIPGAAAMTIAAGGVYAFTQGLLNFKEAKWVDSDTDALLYSIETILTGFIEIFDKFSYDDIFKAMFGANLLGDLGNSIAAFARGLSAFANGQEPEYAVKDGKLVLVGTKPLGKDLGKRVGETIKEFLTPLIGDDSVLYQLGQDQGWFFDGPVGNGIDLLGRLGNSLGGFAKGIQAMANLQVPTYGVNEKGELVLKSTEKLSPSFATDMGNNIKMMLEPLVGSSGGDGSDSILGKIGAGQGLFFDGPVGDGIDLLSRLGNSLGNFAQGVQAWANLLIPVWGKNDKGELVIVDYKKLDKGFSKKVGANIKKLVKSLTEPLEFLGQQSGGWFSSSDYETGIEMLEKLSKPLEGLAKGVEVFANVDVDPKKVKKVITGTIGSFVESLSKESLQNIDEKNGKKVLDGFNYFATAVEKIKGDTPDKVGKMFISMKDSINGMDLKKLNKLNDLAHNLSMFANNMKGSFSNLEKVLEKLKNVVAEMNGIEINSSGSTSGGKTPQVKLDLIPIIDELDSIKEVLLSGIEVEVKDSMLSR